MGEEYLGKLPFNDPLYEILASSICTDVRDPRFHVTRTSSRMVYKYTEEKTRIALIGKFYHPDDKREDKVTRIKGEYDNLRNIRSFGFDTSPYYVVKPINRSEKIGLALIEEFIYGKDLDYYLKTAIYEGKGFLLKDRLSRLALFLFALHSKTSTPDHVNLDAVTRYFQRIVIKLWEQRVLSDDARKSYLRLMTKWCSRGILEQAKNAIVHGDATPTNIIFSDRGDVVAIDLERSRTADPAFDVSMVCGELKHAFLWRTGNRYDAEPFIRHFLKSYALHFPDAKEAFREITLRTPFYMALTELRIARNAYLDWQYRKRLACEAGECMKWGLKLQ